MRAKGLAMLLMMAAPAVAAPAAPSDPEDARYSPAYARCMASPEGASTMGMIDCAGQELAIQDGKLNAAYRKAIADVNARQKAKLQAAQRAWVAFRDANCASFEDEDWGSLSRVNASLCTLQMTVRRTIELEAYPPQT